jgi:hypothetical protein
VPTASVEYNVIYINNTTGNNHTITGNYIGGSSAGCGTGGVATGWTKTNAFDNAFTAISLSTGTGTASSIQGNTIAKFTWSNSSNAAWYGMNIGGGDVNTGTVTGNTIGAATGTASILLTGASTGENFYGIQLASTGTTNTQNNIIGAVTVANGATLASNFYGITKTATAGTTTISNNTIGSTITAGSINASSASSGYAQTVNGISSEGTGTVTISGNTIANLTNGTTNATAGNLIGLYVNGGTTGTVSSNFIYSLTADASSTATSVYGIKAGTGATTYSNNIITLGGNTATTMYGIYESGTSGNNNSLYFNTIYIGGSPAAGVTNKSYVLYSASNANSRDFRNNIFFNARSTTGGSNLHYAAWFNYGNAGSLTLGNNNYNTTGAGTVPGYYNSANVNSLPLISTLDIGSIPGNPLFASPGGTLSANYIPSNNYLLAATGTGQATDYAGTTRSSTLPAMGAYEITVVNSSLVTVNATAGTATAGYSSLKSAFDAINAGTHKGNVTVIINGNITELQSAVLNASGTGNASYITTTIYPSVSGLSITGNMEAPLIDLNGADKVTIDGRVNATGSTSDLIIINTNTSATSGTSSIRLINDAKNNTVKYCNLKGSSTSSVDGIILFSTGTTDGNDGNTITNNNITGATDASRPINALFSLGTAGKENSGNTISNNNIYNFLNRGIASFGINLGSNSTAWILSGNSFYETASFVPTASVEYNVIYITNTTGNNHTISGNYIGGSSAGCGTGGVSTGWTKTNAFDNAFTAINLSLGTGTASNIQGNTIAKFTWSNSSNASWYGMNIGGGDVNTGTVTGNTIGAATGTGSILLTGASTGETFYGINIASSGTTNTQNNTIGAVTVANGATLAGNIYGITKTATAGITTISNNTIGNATNANSIYAYSKSTGNPQLVYGINSAGTGAITISGNTIANLTNGINANNVSNGIINGIYVSAGTNSITGNTVHDLLIYTSNSSVLYQTAVGGIVFNNTTAAAQLISGNSIYNLNSPYYGNINGIYYNGGTTPSKVSENAIYNYITSTNEKTLYGINIRAGSATYVNNVISIIPTGYHTIYGIYESGAAGNDNNLIFNTVYIGGTPTSGPRNSYALYSALTTNTRNFRNNIFYNARSSNGTHYAAYFATSGATGLTEDYNDYYAPGTGGILGFFNNANVTTLAAWKTATGKDVNSFNSNPIFALTGGSMAGDYSPGTILAGTSISDITTDYLGLARSASAPSMGAFENQSCNVLVLATAGTATGGYATLKGAFDAINTGTHQGVITLKILNSTTETAAAVLNASGSGAASYTSALIYPVLTGLSVTGNFATPLIDLNGADNVTFDGRVNATGTNKDLLISNTSTAATTGTSTIRFINDATTNTVKYCNLKGSTTDYNAGIVFFSTAGAGNGNDGSTFDNNNITSTTNASRPINTICSIGTGSKENSNNTISNNFIYNFLNKGTGSNGISIGSNNTAWTISDNSFYETASFVPNNYASYTVIYISSGINHTISGNYIGGSSSGCGTGGSVTVWTKTWANENPFTAIYLNTGTGTASNIQGNTIAKIDWENNSGSSWYGINIAAGDVNIGTVTGNTIGAETGTESLKLYNYPYYTSFYGINIASTGTVNVKNNTIGAVTVYATSTKQGSFFGINKTSTAGTTNISNNIIGSTVTANSINSASTCTNINIPQLVYGIYSAGTGNVTISGNTIANLTNGTTNTDGPTPGLINGIYASGGTYIVSNNTVRNLSIASANTAASYQSSVSGIVLNNPAAVVQTIIGNTIYNLSNTYASFAGNVNGIYYNGGTAASVVSNNFVYGLSVTGTSSTTANLYGIKADAGAVAYSNNIITLCGNSKSTIYGISETGDVGNNNYFYFNTLYIGGQPPSSTNKSYALYSGSTLNTRNLRNNIFSNSRSTTGGSNLHYAVYLSSATGLTSNYNDYYAGGAGGTAVYLGGNLSTLNGIKSATGQDLNSMITIPGFVTAGGTEPLNYALSGALPGTSIPGIQYDYINFARNPTPTIGALEYSSVTYPVDLYIGTDLMASFTDLTSAFDRINDGSYQGAITIKVKASHVLTAPAVLYASGTGESNYSSITVYPTVTGISITGNLAAPLIDLNGADHVTIDGRVEATGTSTDLLIANTNFSSIAGTSTIRFISDAKSNIVQYCTLKGSTTSATDGIILFSTGTTDGNDGNTIDNNNITSSGDVNRPVNAIFSAGTAAKTNSGNAISYNNIYDFMNRVLASNGIKMAANNTTWSITGNSFYETASFVPTADVAYTPINVSDLTSTDLTINGNFIGGSAPSCVGTAWTKTNAFTSTFYGINLNVGPKVSAETSVQGNIIKNFAWGDAGASSWTAINIPSTATGNLNIGTVTANTIGATTGNGSIVVTASATGANVYGMNIGGTGIVDCENNTVGSITGANGSTLAINIYGINKTATAGTTTIINNTIGSSATANSISAGSAATANAQNVYGISSAGTGNITLTGNTIANLNNGSTHASLGSLIGLNVNGGTVAGTVSGNFIYGLTAADGSTATAVYGIKADAGVRTYANNIISLGGDTRSTLYGIYDAGAASQTCNLYFNTVYIGGSPASGALNSYALYNFASSNTRDYRNNLFSNARSNSGATGKHYAAYFSYSTNTGLTLNFNDYFASGTGGVLGYYSSANKTALPLVTGMDVNSRANNPVFATPGGILAENYIPSAPVLTGTTGSGVTTDYTGTIRSTSVPSMGAYEFAVSGNVMVSATTPSTTGSYLTLKAAFDAINSGTHKGALALTIVGSTTETATAVLNASGTGSSSYTSVLIYPVVTGLSITGNLAAPLIDLNGADNVIIDGRVHATGAIADLVISNTSTLATAGTSTLRFINDATTNTVKYCIIKGSTADPAAGIFWFSTTTGTTGNDNNTIDKNNITNATDASRPLNTVYSLGTSSKENSGNTISNNKIYDHFNTAGTSYGINIGNYTTACTISGNSFYETTSFAPFT